MNIIVEGPDGSGKSTLAQYIADALGRNIVRGSGPPRYDGDIGERVERYLQFDNMVMDRHPIVSDNVYGPARPHFKSGITTEQVLKFYSQPNIFIYCHCDTLAFHQPKTYDTKEHLENITTFFRSIVRHYGYWAADKAHIIYRIGDPIEPIVSYCKVRINS